MKFTEIVTLVLGAAGLWKFLEVFVKLPIEKKLRKAESRHFDTQSDSQIMDKWVQWSEKLEERIKELEAEAEEMRSTIVKQTDLIESLKNQIEDLIEINLELKNQITPDHD